MKPETYKQATDYLFSRKARGMKLGLKNMRRLLDLLEHPEDEFKSIHIAGTNGKGSTAAILESILKESGYKTGLYTSPHLIDMRERITIRGTQISEDEVLDILNRMISHIEKSNATFFEILTAMAFMHFSINHVELAVIETGLGGRLDATTLLKPILTIITAIGLDHTKILGKGLKEIAREKAGILKQGITCISGTNSDDVKKYLSEFAEDKKSPLLFTAKNSKISNIRLSNTGSHFDAQTNTTHYKDLHLKLLGNHQLENCRTALQAVEYLNENGYQIPEYGIRKGLKNVSWRARLELLQDNPQILIDSAHNPMGMQTLVQTIQTQFTYNRLILIFGVLADKNYKEMFSEITPLVHHFILTKPLSDRALDPHELLKLPGTENRQTDVIPDIGEAWNRALSIANKDDLICACGSIYFVGEILRIWDTGKIRKGDEQ